ncbi:hypothetical protein [Actinopolymorpha alba]|uniref:hypothetical protein n=1 Tax=Actinopolymorpha alba TaxID=533267 RepID=UPI00037F6B66|nr:hypothetical protein [Actinopolymorpha alba]
MSTTLTLRRTGGFAGFNDELTVTPDGKATLKSRGKKPVSCTVNPAAKAKLDGAAKAAAESPQASSTRSKDWKTPIPDAIHLTLVVGDKQIRFKDLAEGGQQEYRELFKLLNDVLTSASAIREGEKVSASSPCSR